MRWMLLLLVFASFQVAAHGFSIVVYAPFSGTQAAIGEALWNGMRVATRERDGHADETSDGHLGGMDSHLLRLDSQRDGVQLPELLRRLSREQGTALLVSPGAERIPLAPGSGSDRWVLFTGDRMTASAADQIAIDEKSITLPVDFAARYRQQFSNDPTAVSRIGYLSARLIDAAVRDNGEELGDRQAMLESLRRHARSL